MAHKKGAGSTKNGQNKANQHGHLRSSVLDFPREHGLPIQSFQM